MDFLTSICTSADIKHYKTYIMNTFSIPPLPSEFNDYQNNVVPLMNAKATEYGILPKALTDLAPMKIKWDGLEAACRSESTMGVGATANRNAYQPIYSAAIESIVILYLLNNVSVIPADQLTFHIKAEVETRVSTPAPTSTLIGKVIYKESLAHFFKLIDTISNKMKRPDGTCFIELRYFIGLVPPASVQDCNESEFINNANKKVEFTAADEGKFAFYFARYINKNGKKGPWSLIFSGRII